MLKIFTRYNRQEAASYLGIPTEQLEIFTDLGWIKFWGLEDGETIYLEWHLDQFGTHYLIPLTKAIGF